MPETSFNFVSDHTRRPLRILMLPDSYAEPTSFGEATIGIPISSSIRLDFIGPVLAVGYCNSVMFRASVPETSVKEHRDPSPGK